MPDHMDPNHSDTRATLRIIGPLVLATGLVFMIIGIGNFFWSFNNMEPPRYFWCAFIGMPLLAVGMGICKFAYLGSIARYMANEIAPVGKDTTNYMVGGTRGAVRDLAAAVGEGLRGGTQQVGFIRCHKCNADNELPANFCKACGVQLSKSRACPDCKELIDPDAQYCDNCGRAMA